MIQVFFFTKGRGGGGGGTSLTEKKKKNAVSIKKTENEKKKTLISSKNSPPPLRLRHSKDGDCAPRWAAQPSEGACKARARSARGIAEFCLRMRIRESMGK